MAEKPRGTAVAQRPPKTMKELVMSARAQIASVLPAHMDVDKVLQGVRLAIAQNRDLEECTQNSLLFAVMAASRIGLELNSPLQHAWLIPYAKECTLQIGYRGYQELARRGGEIRNIEARGVYKGDDFDYELGSKPFVKHKPAGNTEAKDLHHAYAIAFPKDGGTPIIEVMTRAEVDAARKVSRFSDKADSPWVKWYGEMARKTAVRRLAKYLPLSPEMAAAIELDLRAETGKVHDPSTIIDTDASLAADMKDKTETQLGELRERIGGPSPQAGGVEGAPAATATAAPPPEAAPPPANGEKGPPW
jgi:recombination protein RecT